MSEAELIAQIAPKVDGRKASGAKNLEKARAAREQKKLQKLQGLADDNEFVVTAQPKIISEDKKLLYATVQQLLELQKSNAEKIDKLYARKNKKKEKAIVAPIAPAAPAPNHTQQALVRRIIGREPGYTF